MMMMIVCCWEVLIVSNNLIGIKPSHKVWNIKPTNETSNNINNMLLLLTINLNYRPVVYFTPWLNQYILRSFKHYNKVQLLHLPRACNFSQWSKIFNTISGDRYFSINRINILPNMNLFSLNPWQGTFLSMAFFKDQDDHYGPQRRKL